LPLATGLFNLNAPTALHPGLKLKTAPSQSAPKAPSLCTPTPLIEVTPAMRPSSLIMPGL